MIFEFRSSPKESMVKGCFFDGAVTVECIRHSQGEPGYRKDRVIVQFFKVGEYKVYFSSRTAISRRTELPECFSAIVDGLSFEKLVEHDHLPSFLGVEIAIEGKTEKHYF